MTLLTMNELSAPYRYVLSEEAVADVRRLLQVVPALSVSHGVWSEIRTGQRSILELEGLGREVWKGIDPQQYIDGLRDEWNNR